MAAKKNASRFAQLFAGNDSAYGIFTPQIGNLESGKAKGICRTVTEPVTPELYDAHLNGTQSLGIVPINTAGECYFGAIDIDDYTGLEWVPQFINRYSLPLVPIRSKSGGIHLYCFLKAPLDAKSLVALLQEFRAVLGLPESTEVFPKQTRLEGIGNWINLPYYKSAERRALDSEGNELSLEAFLDYAEATRATKASLRGALEALPLSSAPPCLQAMYLTGEVSRANSGRNTFLFNAGVYLRSRFGVDELSSRIEALNETLPNKLSPKELNSTVIRTHTKRTYKYQCTDHLLKRFCNLDICANREFGKSSASHANLNYGEMKQLMYEPPYYEWVINNITMRFMSESELLNQDRFIEQCVRYLHTAPRKMKAEKWSDVLAAALSAITVVIPEDSDVVTENAGVWEALREFFEGRSQAKYPEDVLRGLVYVAPEGKLFHLPMLVRYLEVRKTKIQTRELALMLESIGVETYTGEQKASIPCKVKLLPNGAKPSQAYAAQRIEEAKQAAGDPKVPNPISDNVGELAFAPSIPSLPSNPIDALRKAASKL